MVVSGFSSFLVGRLRAWFLPGCWPGATLSPLPHGPPGQPLAWVSDVQPREAPGACSCAARTLRSWRRPEESESAPTLLHPRAPSSGPPFPTLPRRHPLSPSCPRLGLLRWPYPPRGPLWSSRNHAPAHGFPCLTGQVPPPGHHPATAGSTRVRHPVAFVCRPCLSRPVFVPLGRCFSRVGGPHQACSKWLTWLLCSWASRPGRPCPQQHWPMSRDVRGCHSGGAPGIERAGPGMLLCTVQCLEGPPRGTHACVCVFTGCDEGREGQRDRGSERTLRLGLLVEVEPLETARRP